jgi:2-methylisocitrate lyase-like PEP mutase family enzyme
MKKSTRLRQAIMERRAVVVPGCHDALSARVIESCGFEATQISGFGVAGSLLGRPDVGLVQMKDVLDTAWNIVQAVNIPVMADADTGGGNAINAAWITERLITMGCAGMNIEDQVFPKRCGHMAGKEVISADEMAGKIKACIQVRGRLDPDFVINARTDALAVHGLDEAIRRGNLYLDAGADLVFIDAIATRADIEKAVRNVKGPEGRAQRQGPVVREPDGWRERNQNRAHSCSRARAPERQPGVNPDSLGHGDAQGTDGLFHSAASVCHRHFTRAGAVADVIPRLHSFHRIERIPCHGGRVSNTRRRSDETPSGLITLESQEGLQPKHLVAPSR